MRTGRRHDASLRAEAIGAGSARGEGLEVKLAAHDLKVHFGGVRAVDGVDLELAQGEVLGLIGPNGAGKTTLVNAITGFQKPTAGSVHLGDRDVTRWPAQARCRQGLIRTFQAVRLFAGISVRENVEVAALGVGLSAGAARERASHLLEIADFGEWASASAANLPHGTARTAGVLRALAADPLFLLMDEPAAGLDEEATDQLGAFVGRIISEMRCGLLLIEHDMRLVMSVCHRVQVLDYGKTICIGQPDEVRRDPRVVEAYLGAAA
jgi:branched-chain amino acid transport system ATP-binding protein